MIDDYCLQIVSLGTSSPSVIQYTEPGLAMRPMSKYMCIRHHNALCAVHATSSFQAVSPSPYCENRTLGSILLSYPAAYALYLAVDYAEI